MRAAFYESLDGGDARCLLCPHKCVIAPGEDGYCRARCNDGGELVAKSYGKITAMALDPIEKKPLRHFMPGTKILSLGSFGCNFRCGFCQNHSISMGQPEYRLVTPEEIAALSLADKDNVGVAYTYNEPLIGYEFVIDCADLIKKQGQKNVLVTNGYINEEPFEALLPLIDAMNIDLKSFNPAFYRDIGGEAEFVKNIISRAASACHVEITTLVITGKNDSEDEMRSLSEWLSGISDEIPLHVGRFFPNYKWNGIPATPVETVYRLADTARQKLKYVYTGNC